jgi:hypothetical protein
LKEANLMAIDINDPGVDVLQEESLHEAVLLSLNVSQIVGVNNSYHFAKFCFPSTAMVVPSEVFRLF